MDLCAAWVSRQASLTAACFCGVLAIRSVPSRQRCRAGSYARSTASTFDAHTDGTASDNGCGICSTVLATDFCTPRLSHRISFHLISSHHHHYLIIIITIIIRVPMRTDSNAKESLAHSLSSLNGFKLKSLPVVSARWSSAIVKVGSHSTSGFSWLLLVMVVRARG